MNPNLTVAYFSNGLVKNHQLANFAFEEGGKLMYLTCFVSLLFIFWLVNSWNWSRYLDFWLQRVFHFLGSLCTANVSVKSGSSGNNLKTKHVRGIAKDSFKGKRQIIATSKQNWSLGGSSQLGYVVNNHGDWNSPIPGVVGPLPNGRTSWLIDGGYLLTTYDTWGDPTSGSPKISQTSLDGWVQRQCWAHPQGEKHSLYRQARTQHDMGYLVHTGDEQPPDCM